MADPYNPYTSHPTPTSGGASYYSPEQRHQQQYPYQQQPYGSAEADPNYPYAPRPTYHLAPEPYLGSAPDRSYTPVGQPDNLGPVVTAGMPSSQSGKVPENLGYYGHPAEQPRYTPSPVPHPPSVYVSEADHQQAHGGQSCPEEDNDVAEGDRGIGSSLAGGAAGYYFGHKKEHGFLGALGGAIIGNLLEDKMKDHGRHSHGRRHGHGGHHHHHDRHHRHSRSRSRYHDDSS